MSSYYDSLCRLYYLHYCARKWTTKHANVLMLLVHFSILEWRQWCLNRSQQEKKNNKPQKNRALFFPKSNSLFHQTFKKYIWDRRNFKKWMHVSTLKTLDFKYFFFDTNIYVICLHKSCYKITGLKDRETICIQSTG